MRFKYILFDLDGTLIDTNQLIIDSFKHTYKKHLNLDVEDREILQHFGEPLITTLQRYATENVQELYNTYIDFNEKAHDTTVSLCCNIRECLQQLHDMGCKMAVVTAKRGKIAHQGLELFDIKKYFSAFVTLDDTKLHKPHPDPVYKAMEILGAVPEETVMIGDSIFDIMCAHNANIEVIQVSWGAALEHQQQDKPDYLVKDALEIIDIVSGK